MAQEWQRKHLCCVNRKEGIRINTYLIAYASVNHIANLTTFGSALIAGGLTFRCVLIFFQLIGEDISWKDALISMKKRIIGAIIAVTVTGIVAFVRSFY